MPNDVISYIDLAIILVLIVSIYRGFKNGFITEFMKFFGTYVSLVLSIRYMSNLAMILYGALSGLPHAVVTIIAFLLIFVPLMTAFRFITKKLKLASKFSITLGSLDRVTGLALGLLKGAIFVSLCTLIISFTGLSRPLRKEIDKSMLFYPMRRVLPLVYSGAKLVFMNHYKSFYDELKESLYANKSEAIDWKSRELLNSFKDN